MGEVLRNPALDQVFGVRFKRLELDEGFFIMPVELAG
jgi:ABC-type cobalamin transport system ATPase subunit